MQRSPLWNKKDLLGIRKERSCPLFSFFLSFPSQKGRGKKSRSQSPHHPPGNEAFSPWQAHYYDRSNGNILQQAHQWRPSFTAINGALYRHVETQTFLQRKLRESRKPSWNRRKQAGGAARFRSAFDLRNAQARNLAAAA